MTFEMSWLFFFVTCFSFVPLFSVLKCCLVFSNCSLRKRQREERIASTAQKVQQMKQRLTDSEKKQESWVYWRPILLNVGAGAAVAVGLLVCWMYCQWKALGHLKRTHILHQYLICGTLHRFRWSYVHNWGYLFLEVKCGSARSNECVYIFN